MGFRTVAGVLLLTSIAFGTWQSRGRARRRRLAVALAAIQARGDIPPGTGDWRLELDWKLETGDWQL